MSASTTVAGTKLDLPPVVDDLSVFVLGGRIKQGDGGYQAHGGYDVAPEAPLRDQARDAERLGFRGIWLSERFNLKESAVVLGGAAAVTSRITVGPAALAASSRLPIVTAAIGGTMNAMFGSRYILGLGRGNAEYYWGHGFSEGGCVSFEHLLDYARLVKRLWNGETVNYSGPAGTFENLRMIDTPETPPPIWFVHLGGPRASRMAADPVFDGAMLVDLLNPIATAKSVRWTREECERIGRDPSTLRICQAVVTAPEMDDIATRSLLHARVVGALDYKVVGEMFCNLNEWDPAVMHQIRNHPKFQDMALPTVDLNFHRDEILDVTELLPDEWMRFGGAIGSISECVASLQRFRDAGADEIAVYGSTPIQNAKLVEAWTEHANAAQR